MPKVKRWVCACCGAIWHVEVAEARGKCPSCGGTGAQQDCDQNEAGVVTPIAKKHE